MHSCIKKFTFKQKDCVKTEVMHGIGNKLRMWINGCMNNYFYNVVLKLTSNNDFAYLPTSINPMLPN